MKTFDFRSIPRKPSSNGKPGPLALPILSPMDEHVKDASGAPQYFVLLDFLLARTGDDAFVGDLAGIEGIEMQLDTRKAIRSELEKDDGLVTLEDGQAQRLARAILKPSRPYLSEIATGLYPFLIAAKNVFDGALRDMPRATEAPAEAAKN